MTPLRGICLCCLGAATPAALAAQSLPFVSQHTPKFEAAGVPIHYGVILPGGFSLYNSGPGSDHASRPSLRIAASSSGQVALEFRTGERPLGSGISASLRATASRLEQHRYGMMGATLAEPETSAGFARVRQHRYEVAPTLTTASSNGSLLLDFGPVFKYSRTELAGIGPVAGTDLPYGFGGFAQVGAHIGMRLTVAKGLRLAAGGSAYPALLDVARPFAETHGELSGAVSLPGPASPTLSLRAGGKKLWGAAPFHEAAFLGGTHSLRALPARRLAGDAVVYGGAELRFTLGRQELIGVPLRYGIAGIADVGRVFYDGTSPDGWIAGLGGGVWLSPGTSPQVFSLGVARSTAGTRLYVSTGIGF